MKRGAAGAASALALALAVGGFAGPLLVVADPLDRPEAIVSLASHEWERLPETAAQAARFPDARIVLTRPSHVTRFNCHDCDNRGRRLARAGVAESRVIIVSLSAEGTYGEALAVRQLLDTSGLRRVLVVTSPYHTRRALATFRTVLEPVGARVGIAAASATSPAQPPRWWASPYDRAYVAYEWAATIYYAVRYGVWPWQGAAAAGQSHP